jgi:hypothetical protein
MEKHSNEQKETRSCAVNGSHLMPQKVLEELLNIDEATPQAKVLLDEMRRKLRVTAASTSLKSKRSRPCRSEDRMLEMLRRLRSRIAEAVTELMVAAWRASWR